MIIKVKLQQATYLLHMDGQSMTLDCEAMGSDKRNKEVRLITSTLGYFGPFQFENAIKRIVQEELSRNGDTGHLADFLRRYKVIEANIIAEATALKLAFKESNTSINLEKV